MLIRRVRSLHIEAAGLIRSFKVLNNLSTSSEHQPHHRGGGSLNVNYEVIHNLRLVANSFYSDGGGRYTLRAGPDVIVKPNGTLSGIHSGSGIGGFEYQATPSYMFYGYYGGAYFQRNFGFLAATPTSSCDGVSGFNLRGALVSPGSANTSNRAIQEGTFGVIPTLWSESELRTACKSSPNIRTSVRSTWSGPLHVRPESPRTAHTHIWCTFGLRYILP